MEIAVEIEEARRICKAWRREGATLGVVPTMGALHEGHLSLVRAARASCDRVAATIFVNPLQFAPNEDFARYPRTFERDSELLQAEGVDLLFAPTREEMYPASQMPSGTWVDVPAIGGRLDGLSRPGHFRGVATVVAKLFHILAPDRAFFGQKDAAQVAVLRAMVRDLNFDVELVVQPTVRDGDGLALSSRNAYLSAEERAAALVLSRSLRQVEAAVARGVHEAGVLRGILLTALDGVPLEYAEVVDPQTLAAVDNVRGGALVAVAAKFGATRLIDNVVLQNVMLEAGP
jgi:pantoate--beta-alanine ligase